MTREEAIKVLTNLQNGHGVSYSEDYGLCFGHKWMQAYEMAIAALREQDDHFREATKKVGHKWISVEERLPTEKDANPNKSVLAIEIREGLAREWIWDSVARYPKSFTHWMPLPEPPKEEA